jgi:short-subunit dehydrogenase
MIVEGSHRGDETGKRHCVFTSSATAFSPADAFLDYSATKAAIVAFYRRSGEADMV